MTVENHGLRFEGIPHRILQENRPRSPNFRQIQSNGFQQFLLPVNRFGIFHGRLKKAQAYLRIALPKLACPTGMPMRQKRTR